jgi:starch-binding outer membrane protein, SusD/RagB family
MQIRVSSWLLAGAVALTACDLDLTNPNAPIDEDILTTREGIHGLAIGLQARYGAGMVDFVYPSGLLTDELATTQGALQSYRDAELGQLQKTSAPVFDLFASHYRTIKTADDLITNAPNVSAVRDSTLSGILALAYLLKAASLGELLQGYQRIAITTYNVAAPTFVDRATALSYVLALLDTAWTRYNTLRPGSEFNGTILATGFSLPNTIRAMQARYHRMTNGWPAALTAAAAVDLNVLSTMPFNDQARNPIFNLTIYVRPRDAWRLSALPADTSRTRYHITVEATAGFHQALDNYRRYAAAGTAIPLYYPDEIRLIRAEALTEQDLLVEAQAVLDSVRTDCGGAIDEPNACLPALGGALTKDSLLAEIAYQRKFELFATGLRWEDARRSGLVGATSIAKRCWLLYPLADSNVNPNVPLDPEPTDPPAFPATCS